MSCKLTFNQNAKTSKYETACVKTLSDEEISIIYPI